MIAKIYQWIAIMVAILRGSVPLPWMRSERKTSADGDVALARALQASRFAASADAVEESCEAATAPTREKFVRVF